MVGILSVNSTTSSTKSNKRENEKRGIILSISLLANTEINDGMINYTSKDGKTQPEVMAYLQQIMHDSIVITQDFYDEDVIKREGINCDRVIALEDNLDWYGECLDVVKLIKEIEIDNPDKNIVVFGSQELYELVFPISEKIYMIRHHYVEEHSMNFFPEITYLSHKIDSVEKLETEKKYGYKMSYVTYSKK